MNIEKREPKMDTKPMSFKENLKLNDEYDVLEKDYYRLNQRAIESILDENDEAGYLRVTKDDDGKVIEILAHLIREGKGKLGQLLQNSVPDEGDYGKYVLEAYNKNPKVKEIIDEYYSFEEKLANKVLEMSVIREKKKEYYQSTANINKLLEYIGVEVRLDENIDLMELKETLRSVTVNEESKEINDPEKFKMAVRTANKLFSSFQGEGLYKELNTGKTIKIEGSMHVRYQYNIDFAAIHSHITDIGEEIIRIQQSEGKSDLREYITLEASLSWDFLGRLGSD